MAASKSTGARSVQVKDRLTANAEEFVNHKLDVNTRASIELRHAEQQKREMLEYYRSEEQVELYVSPTYQAYFGKVMPVRVNGCTIFFAVDGTVQTVPKTFADLINARRRAIDKVILRRTNMANVKENFERSPGELKLI